MWLTLKSNRINRAQVYSLTAILYHSLNGYRGEKRGNTLGYELWSSKVCERDLIRCWRCMRNEFWSTCEALHIFGLYHVFKIKFDPLSKHSNNGLWSAFDFRCNHWYKRGAKFIIRTIWKWIKLHYPRKYVTPRKWIKVHFECMLYMWKGFLHIQYYT